MASDAVSSGALFIGLVFAIWLSASCVHFTSSFLRRTADPWQWQLGVIFLTALSTAHTGILCHSAYGHLIAHFGDSENLSTTGWDLTAHLAILLALATIAQLYYAFKLSMLYDGKRRAVLVGVVVFFTCVNLAFGIAASYSSFHTGVSLFMVDLGSKFGWQLLTSSLAAFLANSVVAAAMLRVMRSGRFAAREETPVEVLSRLLLETNFVTFLVSVLAFAFLLAWNAQGHESGVFLGLTMSLPKLYLLSFLSSLERGAEVQGGLSRNMKHASSLSDMFKGVPLSRLRGPVTTSCIGTPTLRTTPIADRFAGGAATPEQPGWLRRTFQPTLSTIHSVTPLEPLAPPSSGFASATRGSLVPPHAERPVTSLSVSDYGAWMDDDADGASAASAAPGAGVVYAGSQVGAAGGEAYASGVEHAAQTPTPKKATFGLAISGDGLAHGKAGAPAGGPIRYGYL